MTQQIGRVLWRDLESLARDRGWSAVRDRKSVTLLRDGCDPQIFTKAPISSAYKWLCDDRSSQVSDSPEIESTIEDRIDLTLDCAVEGTDAMLRFLAAAQTVWKVWRRR